MDVYQRNGYKNRRDYLENLASNHAVPLKVVLELASVLGPEEDFDGLVTMTEDAEAYFGED